MTLLLPTKFNSKDPVGDFLSILDNRTLSLIDFLREVFTFELTDIDNNGVLDAY